MRRVLEAHQLSLASTWHPHKGGHTYTSIAGVRHRIDHILLDSHWADTVTQCQVDYGFDTYSDGEDHHPVILDLRTSG
eukprot:2882637-Pyramimonas_sp.AAC.1